MQPAARDDSPLAVLESPVSGRRHPLIAIPTTAGTGSEATEFAVLYARQAKRSVLHSTLRPDVAVLDPTLTYSQPPRLTASTGLDAVSQALESMWSVRSTNDSIEVAERALRLGIENLEKAVLAPDPASRAGMLQAAHLAGQAINISHTTAPHALSYAMTIRHNVPHGMAVAISVGHFLLHNSQATADTLVDPRGMPHFCSVMRRIAAAFQLNIEAEQEANEIAKRWHALLGRIGCPTTLREWNIADSAERQVIAAAGNNERLANNPRKVSQEDLRAIVEALA